MIGQTVAHYQIHEKLGEGGMGEVYLATDTKLGRKVALKFLPQSLSADPEARERLLREAQAASRLSHPNILTVHAIEQADDRDFIVMEYVAGQPLSEFCGGDARSVSDIVDLTLQLAEGLNRAHEAGVTHRDLKPANILVDADGRAKILDFGLAKLEGTTKLTQTGSTVGTMAYFAPEQAQGQPADPRSDIFSLGVILYQMLANRLPFSGEHQAAIVYGIVNEEPQPLSRYNRDVPDELQRLVSKCLAKNPQLRYQSTRDLLADLRACIQASAKGPSHTSELERPMVAVLPFQNLGPAEEEYFADGMTEEITSRLASVKALGVISRTSSMRYKQTDKSIKEIGAELGASYILEGTVRWGKSSGGPSRVRITPQLIRVSDDTHMWSDRYDRVIEDIFDVQSDIAEQVFEQLNVTLLEPEREVITARPTANLEAYHAYLRGVACERRSGYLEKDLLEAIKLLERAVELDPEFALAWSSLSTSHSDTYLQGYDRSTRRVDAARTAVERALQLDPDLPQARMARGLFRYRCHRDLEGALPELEFAVRHLPNDAQALLYVAAIKRRQGEMEAFLELAAKASELNPRDASVPFELALTNVLLRRWNEAWQCLDLAISIDPNSDIFWAFKAWFNLLSDGDLESARRDMARVTPDHQRAWPIWNFWVECFDRNYQQALTVTQAMPEGIREHQFFVYSKHDLAALIYHLQGRTEEARSSFQRARALYEKRIRELPDDARFHGRLGLILAFLGEKEIALREGADSERLYPVEQDHFAGPYRILDNIYILAHVGELDRAVEKLAYLLSIPFGISSTWVRLDPLFDPIREHPRYPELLEKGSKPF